MTRQEAARFVPRVVEYVEHPWFQLEVCIIKKLDDLMALRQRLV